MNYNIYFTKSVAEISGLPKDGFPQVALCGRSNVGKSSFINAIFGRKNLAKISSTPGKTRMLNFYLHEERSYVVDLPGYGYAKASKTEQVKWKSLIEQYFEFEKNINCVFHVIDSRHEPSELDCRMRDLIKFYGIQYFVILNKVDKLKQSEISAAKNNIKKFAPELIQGESFFLFSSVTGFGSKDVMKKLRHLI